MLTKVLSNLQSSAGSSVLYTSTILSVLLVVLLLSAYEFLVYRFVSHRSFYNRSFNICVSIIPFFIATIILCLQTNIVITLGTIGALAIIRFRTAIKDPVDMLYILWAIHTGIICGCQLYEVAVLTSLVVTAVLFVMENISFGGKPFVLVVHCSNAKEEMLTETLKKLTKSYRIKSRNWTSRGMDFVIEFSAKDIQALTEELVKMEMDKFSVIEYDCDDVV